MQFPSRATLKVRPHLDVLQEDLLCVLTFSEWSVCISYYLMQIIDGLVVASWCAIWLFGNFYFPINAMFWAVKYKREGMTLSTNHRLLNESCRPSPRMWKNYITTQFWAFYLYYPQGQLFFSSSNPTFFEAVTTTKETHGKLISGQRGKCYKVKHTTSKLVLYL